MRLQERTTITVEEAARLLGVGRQVAYLEARRGGMSAIRMGARLVVPVVPLAERLGLSPAELLARLDEDSA